MHKIVFFRNTINENEESMEAIRLNTILRRFSFQQKLL